MNISQVLENALFASDHQIRAEATAQMETAASQNFLEYIGLLTQTLVDEEQKREIRMVAAIAVKNSLTSKDARKKKEQLDRWLLLDDSAKLEIKQKCLATLLNSDEQVGRSIAQSVAAIADIELPRNQWPELIPTIVENTKPDKSTVIKKAALLTIGYICETADPTNIGFVNQANGILLAIVQGAQTSEKSEAVRLTAINALSLSLDFIRQNFQREGERNYIMQVVCEATQAENSDLKASAYGVLAKIMNIYYDYMGVYMEKALYSLTVTGMQSDDEKVACMAIEFWSTVCEEEIDRTVRRLEYGDQLISAEVQQELSIYNFALGAINDVLPTLLNLLTKQNDDLEDDSWSVAMAAGACLQLFANNVGNYVVDDTLKFVELKIGSENWRDREAAIMAFGSILDGPDNEQLKGLINEALTPILTLIKDDNLQVKETVAWCMGRIADLVIDAVSSEVHLNSLVEAIVIGLKDHPKVSTNCCWTLINLIEQLSTDTEPIDTCPLSKYYEGLVPILIELSKKSSNEFSSRASAYEALSALVLYSPNDCMNYVNTIASEELARLEMTIDLIGQVQNTEDKSNLEELQSNILSLLTNVIRRARKEVSLVSDNLMETFLKLLTAQTNQGDSLIEEDIFIAISAIASSIDEGFNKYMPVFLPYLVKALTSVNTPTCKTAVGLVADISRALQKESFPYCSDIMNILGNNLSNPDLSRELRPVIISCFGDIASSIGELFSPFLEVVMKILAAAQNLQQEDGTIESYDYIYNVRESVLDAYVGIIAGFHDKPQTISPYIQGIFEFLQTIPQDVNFIASDSICGSAVGLVGDLAQMFGESISNILQQDWINQFIKHVQKNQNFTPATRATAKWAKKLIK